ncbi:hypothetical protein EDC90_100375 [Martelella mediterranea]|uniref:Uncharacterized protein n=1 Tax=Martelella mediterranea TaxID=293089 RepID=A0A4R3NW95_9HYPH|nr:hypothetical protein EDC90_100375 [Martelella mediterranea]
MIVMGLVVFLTALLLPFVVSIDKREERGLFSG